MKERMNRRRNRYGAVEYLPADGPTAVDYIAESWQAAASANAVFGGQPRDAWLRGACVRCGEAQTHAAPECYRIAALCSECFREVKVAGRRQ
jgi:hypothetical protein